MIKKRISTFFILGALIHPAWAEAAASDLARRVPVYVYRPQVFADQYIGTGIPMSPEPFRGQLWYVRLDRSVHALSSIEELNEFLRLASVPGLDLSQDRILSLVEAERLLGRGLDRLHLLKLAGTSFDDRILPTIARLYDLQVLELNSQITDHGAAFLKNLSHLQVLELPGPGITDQSVPTIAGLSHLERLNLKGSHITDQGVSELRSLPLREIDLGPLTTDRSLEFLGTLSTLEQLDISEAHVTQQGLADLSKAEKIHTLFLGPSVTDADIPALLKFKNVRRLDLTGAHVSDKAAETLSRMDQLEELALTKTNVTGAGFAKLARLPHLRYLEISGTRIRVEDFQHLPTFPVLQVISFSSQRRLSVSDVEVLGNWPRLHSILINGILLGPSDVDYLRHNRRAALLRWFVADVEAASADDINTDLAATAPSAGDKEIQVAELPLQDRSPHVFNQEQGLRKIHQAEASLDDISTGSTQPAIDTFQDNEKNFLGEITVQAGGHVDIKK